jgi:hypothetical protein
MRCATNLAGRPNAQLSRLDFAKRVALFRLTKHRETKVDLRDVLDHLTVSLAWMASTQTPKQRSVYLDGSCCSCRRHTANFSRCKARKHV